MHFLWKLGLTSGFFFFCVFNSCWGWEWNTWFPSSGNGNEKLHSIYENIYNVSGRLHNHCVKHRKNCECCPRHSLFKGHSVIVDIVVLNCQKCNQFLKCQVSGNKSENLIFFLNIFWKLISTALQWAVWIFSKLRFHENWKLIFKAYLDWAVLVEPHCKLMDPSFSDFWEVGLSWANKLFVEKLEVPSSRDSALEIIIIIISNFELFLLTQN